MAGQVVVAVTYFGDVYVWEWPVKIDTACYAICDTFFSEVGGDVVLLLLLYIREREYICT